MHGIGMFHWIDGRVYDGEYMNDIQHGYGVYTYMDKRQY